MEIDEKKLYPLQICRLEDKYVWGTEEFGIADLGYRDSLVKNGWLAANTISEVMDTYLDRVVGEDVYERYGRQFPVQLKTIRVEGKMPLRVHPSDEIASERYDALGKEKFWYILNASSDARLYLGLKAPSNAGSLYNAVVADRVHDLLYEITPKAGECYRIAPGLVHCAEGKMTIIEVSESSALDFCITAWGAELGAEEFDPELNLVEALDFIDYSASSKEAVSVCEIPQFTVNKIDLQQGLKVGTEQFDSFLLYHCLYGEATVEAQIDGLKELNYSIKAGETLLVPAEIAGFALLPKQQNTALLEVSVPKYNPADAYINPDAEPSVEGEDSE